jgi:hypothetical protein
VVCSVTLGVDEIEARVVASVSRLESSLGQGRVHPESQSQTWGRRDFAPSSCISAGLNVQLRPYEMMR